MTENSAVLSLPYIQPSQAQKHVTHNEALLRLDALVQSSVEARDQTTPPAAPEAGARFIVPMGGTGAWAGQDDMLAYYDGTAWHFLTPQPGWQVYVQAEGRVATYDAPDGWQDSSASVWELAQLGVSTSPDDTNRLTVSSPATLLTHAGAGHHLKLNKATPGDTVSLLYQTNWSGRAEMGLVGDDHFVIKLSDDGSSFAEALRIDPATARPALPQGATVTGTVTGTAVTQGPTDATADRLIRAGDGYVKGTILGPVSQSGGVPTGAVIERGSNANGDYVRYADGTQICTHTITLSYNAAARVNTHWSYPAAFATAPNVSFSGNLSDFLANATPGPDEVGQIWSGVVSTTWVPVWLYRLSGMTDFAPGDTCDVRVTAIGRWF